MAQAAVFDGSEFTITIRSGFPNINVQRDLYSGAKRDWANEVDNLHHYPFPFVTIGGEDIGGGQRSPAYFFLQAPWVICTNGDRVLHSFAFNLYASNPDGSSRDPFLVKEGDSLSNNVSDVPAIVLDGDNEPQDVNVSVDIDYTHPVDWETVTGIYADMDLLAELDTDDLTASIKEQDLIAELDMDLTAMIEEETYKASVC